MNTNVGANPRKTRNIDVKKNTNHKKFYGLPKKLRQSIKKTSYLHAANFIGIEIGTSAG